jgi:tetratricopeptide (TPR) repeat protein
MAPNGDDPLNGMQIRKLAAGLCGAFVGSDDLARFVRTALEVRLGDIVAANTPFSVQVWNLVEYAQSRGKTKDLFIAAVQEVPGNTLLRNAVREVWGDIPSEQQREPEGVEARVIELRQIVLVLHEQIRGLQEWVQMPVGPVRPQDSFSIREEVRPAVETLLSLFRQLPAEEQQRLPSLLNDLGKLQVGNGDFEGARQTFTEAARVTPDSAARAEARYNAYWAALEQQKWDEALDAIQEAAKLAPERFSPFPLDRYEPRRILGAGGFGTAFLCRDVYLDSDVVVKTPHAAELVRSPEAVFREARVLHQLSDPAVIGVRDCGYADPVAKERPYVVMDYFPGQSLEDYVRQHGPLSPDDVLAIASQVARGMQAAHRRGVYHRDLKPDNVLVRNEGGAWSVKIIDFGLAMWRQIPETARPRGQYEKSMLTTSMSGTLWYSPPEQVGRLLGVAVGPYSDVYGFGKTFCYALFAVPQPSFRQWRTVPEPLAEWLGECVSEEWQERPQDFETVLHRLGQVPTGRDVDLSVPGRWLTRPAGEAEAQWEFLGETPRRVKLLSGQVYRLEIDQGVTDAKLESLAHLRGLPALQQLSLFGCKQVTDAGLEHLAGLKDLQELSLVKCSRVRNAGLAHLRGLMALQRLGLEECKQVTDAGLEHLAGLKDLRHLDLGGCERVTDAGLQHLAALKDLRHLDLGGCGQVTDAGLEHLRGLTALRHLDLGGCERVTDAGLEYLRGLDELQELDLGGCKKVTDAGLAHLENLTDLQSLRLTGCYLVMHIPRGLPALRQLDLGGCSMMTFSLAHLRDLGDLQQLNLDGYKYVTDADLAQLAGLKDLRHLDLGWGQMVTDAGLAQLAGLKDLRHLDLRGCLQVSDAGLAHLRGLTALRYLDLKECRQVTDAGLNALREALPQCEIKASRGRRV